MLMHYTHFGCLIIYLIIPWSLYLCSLSQMLELADPVGQAFQIAEEFTRQHYIYMNEQRNMISRMYRDDATLKFDTTEIVGKHNIQKFWLNVPSSEHTNLLIDVEPSVVPTSLLFKVRGQVKYKGRSTRFDQCLIIAKQDLTWKIFQNHFRIFY